MKHRIVTLQDALAYQLNGMFFAEKKVTPAFKNCCIHITSSSLRTEVEKYISNADNKLVKIERVFNYLAKDTMSRNNNIIKKLLDEMREILTATDLPSLKDILIINCIQNINAYKISSYRIAYLFAIELELDTAADMIQEILTWEIESEMIFSSLAIEAFRKTQASIQLK